MFWDDYWALAPEGRRTYLCALTMNLRPHPGPVPSSMTDACGRSLARVLEAVPAWKVILRLPAYGWQWTGRPLKRLWPWPASPGKPLSLSPTIRLLSLAQEHG